MSELETILLEDVRALQERWRRQFAGHPEAERVRLLLLALEREQIVAVAYREEAVAGRVAELDVDDEVRALIRQTLVWIWKDEQLHAEFMRGLLLESGGLGSSLVVYGRQVQGALSGWTSSTATNREARLAPFRTGAASALVAVAGALHRMPPELARELRYQTFRRYCALNVALEASAELAYRRLVEVASSEEERAAFERIRDDEARHADAFRLLTGVLTDDDRLTPGVSARTPGRAAGRDQPLVPACRPASCGGGWGERGSGARAAVVRVAGARSWCAAGGPTGTRSPSWRSPSTGPGWASTPPARGWPRSGSRSCSATTGVTARTSTTRNSSTRWPGTCVGTAPRTSPCWSHPRSTATCLRASIGRRGRVLLRVHLPRLPDRGHRRGPAGLCLRPRVRAALDQRHLAGQRPADRDAEAAHRPDRVRAPRACPRWRAAPAPSTRPSTRGAGSTSGPRP